MYLFIFLCYVILFLLFSCGIFCNLLIFLYTLLFFDGNANLVVPRGFSIQCIVLVVVIHSCGVIVVNRGCNETTMFIIAVGLVIVTKETAMDGENKGHGVEKTQSC